MVHPGTLFIGDNGAFLCISVKIAVKFEHCEGVHAPLPRYNKRRLRCIARAAGVSEGAGC
jgi:hypothetical protein